MGWVRISDDYYDHGKFSQVGPLEHALWLAGLAWCNRNRSDGHIPRSTALRLVDWESVLDVLDEAASSNGVINGVSNTPRNSRVAAAVAGRLVKAGLWHETDTGFEVHDYLDYQFSAEQIAEKAKGNAARQKRFRDRQKASQSNADRNGVTNGAVTTPPKPKPKGNTPAPTEQGVLAPDDLLITPDEPSSLPGRKTLDQHFTEFWTSYPRKVGKDDARRAWDKARKRGATPQQITEGCRRYVWDDNPKFIPHPATWLTRGSYADEVAETPHATNGAAGTGWEFMHTPEGGAA